MTSFRELFAFAPLYRSNLTGRLASDLIEGQVVSGNYFSGLGLNPFLGRLIDPADDQADSSGVVVLQYDYWQGRFGGDPAIVGEVVQINQRPFTVIGIAPNDFQGTLQIGSGLWIGPGFEKLWSKSGFGIERRRTGIYWFSFQTPPGASSGLVAGRLVRPGLDHGRTVSGHTAEPAER